MIVATTSKIEDRRLGRCLGVAFGARTGRASRSLGAVRFWETYTAHLGVGTETTPAVLRA